MPWADNSSVHGYLRVLWCIAGVTPFDEALEQNVQPTIVARAIVVDEQSPLDDGFYTQIAR